MSNYKTGIKVLSLKSTNMGKSEREELIDFMNWYNNNPKEFIDNENVVDLYLNSHSPTDQQIEQ